MLHWWRVSGSIVCGLFPYTYLSTLSPKLASTVFRVFSVTRPGIEPCLLALVARAGGLGSIPGRAITNT